MFPKSQIDHYGDAFRATEKQIRNRKCDTVVTEHLCIHIENGNLYVSNRNMLWSCDFGWKKSPLLKTNQAHALCSAMKLNSVPVIQYMYVSTLWRTHPYNSLVSLGGLATHMKRIWMLNVVATMAGNLSNGATHKTVDPTQCIKPRSRQHFIITPKFIAFS